MSAGDRWSGGDAYERYFGRWSRLVEPIFVDWLAIGKGRRWLDVGCGTGALTAVFASFNDYWTPFLSGLGAAPAFAMRLDEEQRTAIRERLRATLPTEPDGSIRLSARAWAARGTTPGRA